MRVMARADQEREADVSEGGRLGELYREGAGFREKLLLIKRSRNLSAGRQVRNPHNQKPDPFMQPP